MKRKSPARIEPAVDPEILEEAKRSVAEDRMTSDSVSAQPKRELRCSVCNGEEATVSGDEQLCWVCRRLKISAWRDSEQQAPAQE